MILCLFQSYDLQSLVKYLKFFLICKSKSDKMSTIKVSAVENGNFSKPILIHVKRINFESTAKQQQIIYYRIPFSFKYQSLEKLKDSHLFLTDCNMQYKIINFVKKTEEVVQSLSEVKIKKDEIYIKNATKEGFIQIQGTVINEANESDKFADISLKDIQGYQKYYEYRKKYKTLENITRRINFSLDHRLKLIYETPTSKQQFFFTLDELKDKEMKNWYIELTPKTKLIFQFQQIISIGNTNIESKIQQGFFDIGELSSNSSYNLLLEMSQYLKITLLMKVVKNKNLSKYQFVALRVLETSLTNQGLKIGNEETIHSSSAVQIRPLIEGRFFDYEYGYLSQNLNQFKKEAQQQYKIHTYLSKLTSSKEKYQNFINQKVIDFSESKNLAFSINNDLIQIPVVYVLEGYNCFMNENWSVKFLLEIVDTNRGTYEQIDEQGKIYEKFQAIPRKLLEVKIKDFLNIGQVINIIQKTLASNENSFFFKIKCQSTIYTIEFETSTVKKVDFKKQAKQLQLKTEYSQFSNGNFVLLKQADIKQNLHLIKSVNLHPFYLIELTDSSSVSFDISTSKDVIMHGQITKEELYRSGEEFDKHIIISPNGQGNQQQKSVISLHFRLIPQQIEGPTHNFKIKYSLTAKQNKQSSFYYDLQILRVQDEDPKNQKKREDKNKLAEKVQLQIEDEFNEANRLKQFSMNRSCFIQKNAYLKLVIKLKRRHYDVDLNSFDNSELIVKTLLFNRNSNKKVEQGILQFELPPHHFREFQFEAYDENINQKVTLKLEIYCSKQPFSIGDQHVYRVKIPHILWKMNNLKVQNEEEPKVSIQTFLSSKKNKTEPKEIIFNSGQEISLLHFNHSDGISVKITHQNGFQDIGYSKIRDCIKAKYHVIKDQILWNDESQWYLAALNLRNSTFYFFIKMQFDPKAERNSSNSSRATQRTKSKEKKETSNKKGGPDIFAKTLKSKDVVTKLKFQKNNLFEEFKQLTSKYVQRQSMIAYLKKKINQLEEENRRREEEMKSALEISKDNPKRKAKNQQKGNNSVYGTICQCGERDKDKIRWGYCEKCIKNLRQRYEKFLKEYQEKASDYEKAMFKKFALRDKIDKIKVRIQGYKNIMKGSDECQSQFRTPLEIQNAYQKMQEKQLALQLQELKLEIFDLERQRNSQFERRSYQMSELEKKIKKQEETLWEKSQQLNKLSLKLKQVQEQIKSNEQKLNESFD